MKKAMTIPAKPLRVLSVAARAGRVGIVVLNEGTLALWEASEHAAVSGDAAAAKLRQWIKDYQPDCLVSENPDSATNKSGIQIPILKALAEFGEDQDILNLVVRRVQPFANAYEEAESFVKRFPELKAYVPKKPRIWQSEHYRLVIFEALAMAREAGLLNAEQHNSWLQRGLRA